MRILTGILVLLFCGIISADDMIDYNLSFELYEKGVFIFTLEGTGRAILQMGTTSIPIFKGSKPKRRYVFHISKSDIILRIPLSMEIADMDYREIDKIPFSDGFELISNEEQSILEKDFIIKDPLKKIMNEIHYLSFSVYNLQSENSLSLYINNMFHSSVPATGNDRWSERITVNIYPYLERNQIADIISFELKDSYGFEKEIIMRDIEFSSGYIIPDDSERGYLLPYNRENPNFIIYNYDDYNPDLYLSFYLYNNTEDNPVQIEFNNNIVKTIRGRSEKDEWSGLVYVKVPEWMVIKGSNSILVRNLYNMESNLKKEWGIKKLYQSGEIGLGAYGSFSSEYLRQHFSERLVYSLNLHEISKKVHISFRLFNVHGNNNVDVYSGKRKIKGFNNITGPGQWSEELQLEIDPESAGKDSVENLITFRRSGKDADWGVDFSSVFYSSHIKSLVVHYDMEELPLQVRDEIEKKEFTDPIIEAVFRANYEEEEDEYLHDEEPSYEDDADDEEERYEERGSIFTFETVPREAMIFVGSSPLYPGRFIGYAPFSQRIDIPPRSYIFVYSPKYGSSIFFHNPVYDFPLYNYYFNIHKVRQFLDTPKIYDIFAGIPSDYRILNTAPFYCDHDLDGFNEIILGSAGGEIFILKREELYDFTKLAEILTIEGSSYVVPFLLDYNNNGSSDMIIGTQEGELMLFIKDEEGVYIFNDFIIPELLQNSRFTGIAPFFFDLNNNNRKDLIFGTSHSGLFYSFNEATDSDPEYKWIKKVELPFDDPPNMVPAVFYNYRDGSYSVIVGTKDGNLIMLQSPKIIDKELKFDNISLLSSPEILDLGFDLVPRVLDFDNNGSHEILIGNRDGEVIIVKYEIEKKE